ncbi:MAG TPA: penicillin-binding transpeptidase domain-containing protein, partial [Anaerolineales bacterium]|nr:penicillin-binding transpeptidase domain-containing protein [Anaerolineales bacterium]
WGAHVAAGCPDAQLALGQVLQPDQRLELMENLGFYRAPEIGLETFSGTRPASWPEGEAELLGTGELVISPLQMARAAAALSSGGNLPSLSLATGVSTAAGGWELFPAEASAGSGLPAGGAQRAARLLALPDQDLWEATSLAPMGEEQQAAWYLAGSLPGSATPRVVVVLLEDANARSAQQAGRALLSAALQIGIP